MEDGYAHIGRDETCIALYAFDGLRERTGCEVFTPPSTTRVTIFVNGINELFEEYKAKGVNVIAISSNDVVGYPMDAPEHMTALAAEHGFTFPYLYDESQAVARAYDAACTPDFSVFDADMRCVYRGQFDGARPGVDIPVTGEDMRRVLDALLAGDTVPEEGQIPSLGCNIKWKA